MTCSSLRASDCHGEIPKHRRRLQHLSGLNSMAVSKMGGNTYHKLLPCGEKDCETLDFGIAICQSNSHVARQCL